MWSSLNRRGRISEPTRRQLEPKTIKYYQQSGFNMRKSKKFNGSRAQYTKKVKRFRNIYCCSDLRPVINELQELTYSKDKDGMIIEDEFNIDSHCLLSRLSN